MNSPAPTSVMQILVVEDSATLRAHIKKMVGELGHKPLFAQSGVEALQMVGSTQFDLVIMDVEMPGLDGFETTGLMREALGERWIPIIFSTTHDSDDKVLAGIEAGGDDYLVKPISRNLLKAKLMSMQRIVAMHRQLSLLNDELSALSQFDALTGLLNRRAFAEKAEQCLHDVARFDRPCAMLMLDVDYFKPYNDHYGHPQGDECLKQIATALHDNVRRESDLVGRYGGEEFVLLLPDTDRPGAVNVARTILAAVDQYNMPHAKSAVADHVTVSIGVASPNERSSLEALIARADKHLYLAKEQGRHRVFADSQSLKTLLLLSDSESRLGELTTHLQPLGNIVTAETVAECLELARDISPDIIIVDAIEQQPTDPSALKQQLTRHVRTAHVPVSPLAQCDDDTLESIRSLLH